MIKISACTIVKNEEKNIQTWLQGVKTYADEIIIVDTGSQDRTVELAKAGGAEVLYFAWINDFSAAKNYAIEQASGDWLVMLDADEYFDEPSQKKVRSVIKRFHRDKKVAGIITPFLNIDVNHGNKILTKAWQMRIFRRDPNLRFVGSVHETLLNKKNGAGMRELVVVEELQFIHTGYSIDNIAEKNRRNLQILQEEIARQGGEQPRHYAYLQDCYLTLQEYEKSVYYGRLALKNWKAAGLIGDERKIICRLLDGLWQIDKNSYIKELKNALQEYPQFPELWVLQGRYLLSCKELLAAETAFRKALKLKEKKVSSPKELTVSAIDSMLPEVNASLEYIERYKPYYAAMEVGDYEGAAAIAVKMLKELPLALRQGV